MKKAVSLLFLLLLFFGDVFAQSNSFPDIILTSPDYPKIDFNGRILYRGVGGNNLTWRYDGTNDAVLIHSANFNSYMPSLTGAGATGNWNINAISATLWGGIAADFSSGGTVLGSIAGYDYTSQKIRPFVGADVRNWLGMPPGGETLQSVTERGNTTYKRILMNLTGDFIDMASDGSEPVQVNAYNTGTTGFRIIQRSNNPLSLWTNTHERLTIDGNGNVGIGTASPAFKLHVNGEAGFSGALYTSNAEGLRVTNPNGYISGWDNTSSVRTGFLQFNTGHSVVLNAENGTFLSFNTGISERMRIKPNGNVGIGTTNPMDYKLAVEGTIGARKIKVTQEVWPDYVFDSSYSLPSLHHIEAFIQQNKHLPEVPSAAAVKKDGLDLGDNQAVLLKKIEELTLYVIQQNKQISQQNTELAEVKRRLAEVEAKQSN